MERSSCVKLNTRKILAPANITARRQHLPKQKKKKTYKTNLSFVVTFTLPSQENHQVVQVVQNAIKNIMITLN
jgi:hypothetical protein